MSKQLKLQVVLDLMDKASKPFKSINVRAARMAGLVKSNNAHLRKLESSLKGVQRQQMSMQAKGIRVSDNMINAEQRLQNEISQTTAKINEQRTALGRLNQQSRNRKRLQDQADRFSNWGGKLSTRVSLPVAGGFGMAAREAMQVEKSLAQVAKFSPEFGGDVRKQLDFMSKIKQSTADLSMQTGKTQVDIASMYEEMGAAGIAAKNWDAYSKTFIKGAVALDMEVGELSQMALGIMASTNNKGNSDYLKALLEKSNLASDMGKMRAVNVLEVANRSLGMAKQAGIKENAFIGLTGAALDAGARDDVTGRAWKTIIARLTSTAKLTKAQNAAWQSLDIDPEIFTKAFKNDPIGKLEELTAAVNKNADGMGELGIIVGTEFVDTVVKMGQNVNTARKIQASLGDEQLRATKLQSEYNRMAETSDSNWKRSISTAKYLGMTLGDQLLPRFNALLDKAKPIMRFIAEWIKANPKLTETIIAITLALATFGPLLMFAGGAISGLMIISRVLPLLTMLAGGFKIFLGILASNPISIIILGIVGSLVLLYQNWDKVTQWFSTNPFLQIVNDMPMVRHAVDFVSQGIELVTALLNGDWGAAWDSAKAMGDSALKLLQTPLNALWDGVKKLGDYLGIDFGAAFDTLRGIAETAFTAMKEMALGIWDAITNKISNAITKIKEFFGISTNPELAAKNQAAMDRVKRINEPYSHTWYRAPHMDNNSKFAKAAAAMGGAPAVKTVAPVTNNVSNDNKKTLHQTVQVTQHIKVDSVSAGKRAASAMGNAMAQAAKSSGSALIGDAN